VKATIKPKREPLGPSLFEIIGELDAARKVIETHFPPGRPCPWYLTVQRQRLAELLARILAS
jgi:hypothetical protein